MTISNLLLYYNIENQGSAYEIERILKADGTDCAHIAIDKSIKKEQQNELLNSVKPVMLLLSDNFLKSISTMENALFIISEIHKKNRLITVIINGRYRKADTGELIEVPTAFERVSNVIQYMNYWQEDYLEMRRIRKDIPTQEEEAFNEKLRIVRSVSSEIGELLRYLRNVNYYEYDESNPSQLLRYIHGDNLVAEEVVSESASTQNGKYASTVNETISLPVIADNIIVETPQFQQEKITDISELLSIKPKEAIESSTVTEKVDLPTAVIEPVIEEVVTTLSAPVIQEISQPEITATNHNDEKNIASEITLQTVEIPEEVVPSSSTNINTLVDEVISEEANKEKGTPKPVVNYDNLDSIFEEDEEENAVKNIENTVEDPELTKLESIDSTVSAEINDNQPNITISNEQNVDLEIENNSPEPMATSEEDDDDDDDNELEEEEISLVDEEVPTITTHKELEHEVQAVKTRLSKGEIDLGLSMLAGMLEKYPENTDLRFMYADILAKKKYNVAAATEQLELLLEQDRNNTNAYFLLGELAEQHHDYLLSKNYFEKVASLDEDYPGIYYKLGDLVANHFKGQKKQAAKYLKQAIKQDENNADAHYQYATILFEHLGKINKAHKHFNETLRLEPNHQQVNFDLAVLHYELGDKAKAHEFYQKAYVINPILKTDASDELFAYTPPPVTETIAAENEAEQTVVAEEIPKYPEDNGIVVMITGATSGIGRAVAHKFAENGYRLILTGRRAERLETIKEEFTSQYQSKVQLLDYDVRSTEAVKNAISSLSDEWKNVDLLINNAGLASGFDPIHEGNLDDWEKMIDTNIKGLLYMTRAVAPGMVARKSGHIINICSTAGKEAYPNGNVYVATKHAVDALTRAMRLDLYKYNIRVSQVSPGHVEDTEFSLVRFHGDQERSKVYEDFTPLNANDVAEAIYFIATRPAHVNIQDILMMGTQQASNNHIDRSGRK